MNYFDASGHLLPELHEADKRAAEEAAVLESNIRQAELFGDVTPEEIDARLWEIRQRYGTTIQILGETGLQAAS